MYVDTDPNDTFTIPLSHSLLNNQFSCVKSAFHPDLRLRLAGMRAAPKSFSQMTMDGAQDCVSCVHNMGLGAEGPAMAGMRAETASDLTLQPLERPVVVVQMRLQLFQTQTVVILGDL
jgi:hypothetical protein